MLQVQKYLKEKTNKAFDQLTAELGIKCNFHPILPLVILNYDQIESPKMHPIVIECRGLVLNTSTFDVVGACMPRFFNLNEAEEITNWFVWDNTINSRVKEDGSLLTLFNYNGSWLIKTRGSWAEGLICENGPTWESLFLQLLPHAFISKHCNINCTYVFEMCSMFNQVVRHYPEPKLFLLTIIESITNKEWITEYVDSFANQHGLNRPAKIDITSEPLVREYITILEQTDGTAEGVVLQDRNNLRIKVKSSTYLAYSRLGNNGNLALDKNLVPLILANEQDEAIAIFPQIADRIKELDIEMFEMFSNFAVTWARCVSIEDQKEFADCVLKKYFTPFSSILFNLKKTGKIKDLTLDTLAVEFRKHPELIIKNLGV